MEIMTITFTTVVAALYFLGRRGPKKIFTQEAAARIVALRREREMKAVAAANLRAAHPRPQVVITKDDRAVVVDIDRYREIRSRIEAGRQDRQAA